MADFGLTEDICTRENTLDKNQMFWMAIESIRDLVFPEKSDVSEYILNVHVIIWCMMQWSFGLTCWEVSVTISCYGSYTILDGCSRLKILTKLLADQRQCESNVFIIVFLSL